MRTHFLYPLGNGLLGKHGAEAERQNVATSLQRARVGVRKYQAIDIVSRAVWTESRCCHLL